MARYSASHTLPASFRKELRSKVQRELRDMENNWWIKKAEETPVLADANHAQKFYEALKTIYGPTHRSV